MSNLTGIQKRTRKKTNVQSGLVREIIELWSMILPVLALIFVFSYIPIYGIMIAFQDYTPGVPILFSDRIKWTGIENFIRFFESPSFWRLIKNTVVLSGLNLIFGFWAPIVFALTLNEVRQPKFKKFTQTASYLPYFISNVVVAGMLLSFLDMDGIVNNITEALGGSRQAWRQNAGAFPAIYTLTNVWKGFGFNSILYLSSISSVDPALYESARLDGAKRFQLIRHITFPAILPTIAIMLIMQNGSILSANSDLILLLYT
ncbi:MAG: sugar ABC transporter permease, partial [Clostridiales bacterium]|nr:sugar ABC transporter permease [Clostridiales bacterium]